MSKTKERTAQDIAKRVGLNEGPRDLSDIAARLRTMPAGDDAKKKDDEIKALAAANAPAPGAFDAPNAVTLALDCLEFSPDNPRKEFDPAKLQELAGSIKRQGLVQPIVVRSLNGKAKNGCTHEIVAGARRVKAARLAGLKTLPAIVRELNDVQAVEVMLTENGQREDVTPMEEARGFQVAIAKAKYTPQALAARTGKSLRYVYARLELLKLPPKIAHAYEKGYIETEVASMLARIPAKYHADGLDMATEEKWIPDGPDNEKTVRVPVPSRVVRSWIDTTVYHKVKAAPFDVADAQLVKDPDNAKAWAPACAGCKYNSDNDATLPAAPGTCTRPSCWDAKLKAHIEKKAAGAELKVSTHYDAPAGALKSNQWEQAKKGANTKPAVLVDGPRAGQVVHVKVAGNAKGGALTPEEKKRRAERKKMLEGLRQETAYREKVFTAAVGKAKWPPSRKLVELAICSLMEASNRIDHELLENALGGQVQLPDYKYGAWLAKQSTATLAKLLLAYAIGENLECSEYRGGADEYKEEIDAAARLAGLDPKKERAAIAKAAEKERPDRKGLDNQGKALAKYVRDVKGSKDVSPEAKKAGWTRSKNGVWTMGKPEKKAAKKATKKPAKKAAKKKR